MKLVGILVLGVLGLVVGLAWLPSIGRAEVVLDATEPKAQTATAQGFVRYADDRLTVRVQDVPVGDVLREMASQSGLTLVLHESLEAPISIEFYQLPLKAALRRLLADHSFALEYAQSSTQEGQPAISRPRTLWVFAKGGEAQENVSMVAEGSEESSTRLEVASRDPVVQSALTSEDPWDREEAIETLGKKRQHEAVEVLGLALQDGNEEVREAAIDALVRIGGNRAVQAVAVALHDKEESIREEAVQALGKIGGAEAVQALSIALNDQDPWLREEAVEALGEIGGERVVELLRQALDDEDQVVRETAVETLTRVQGQSD